MVKDTELRIKPFSPHTFTHTISIIFIIKKAELRLHIQLDLTLPNTKCQIPYFNIRFIFHLDENHCSF